MTSKDIVVINIPYNESNYNQSLGFSIRGGFEHKMPILISKVDKDSIAEKQGLKSGDQIIEVNQVNFKGISCNDALECLTEERDLEIIVAREIVYYSMKQSINKHSRTDFSNFKSLNNKPEFTNNTENLEKLQKIHLNNTGKTNMGFSIRGGSENGTGIFISKVDVGGLSESRGLRPSQQIIEVNGHSFINISHQEAVNILKAYTSLMITVKNPKHSPTLKDTVSGLQTTQRSEKIHDNVNGILNTKTYSSSENINKYCKQDNSNNLTENSLDSEFPIPPPPLETPAYNTYYSANKSSFDNYRNVVKSDWKSEQSTANYPTNNVVPHSPIEKSQSYPYTNDGREIFNPDFSTKKNVGLKNKFFKNKKSYDFLPTFKPSHGGLSPNKASTDSPKRSKRYIEKSSMASSLSGSLSNISSGNDKYYVSSTPRSITSSSYDSDRLSITSTVNPEASEAIIYLLMKKLMKRRDRHKLKDKMQKYLQSENARIEELAVLALNLLNRTDHLIIVKELRNIIRDKDRTIFDLLICPSEQAVEEILSEKQKKMNKSPSKKLKKSMSMEKQKTLSTYQTIVPSSSVSNFTNLEPYLDDIEPSFTNYLKPKSDKRTPFFNKYGSLDTLNKIANRPQINTSSYKEYESPMEGKKTVRIMDQNKDENYTKQFYTFKSAY